MGNTRNVDMSSQVDEVKVVADPTEKEDKAKKQAKAKQQHQRSRKYQTVKSKVDRNRQYDLLSAVELVKQLSYTKFTGTIVADLEVRDLDVTAEVTLPHAAGKQRKVVVADDKVIKQIEEGNLDFDVLVSAPEYMPKLAKHAKVLGPKGLMPNPKNGTLTPNPERAVKELSAGKRTLKAEKKQPLMHVVVGKVSMETKDIIENVQTLLDALKGKVLHLTIAPTMGPGVKVNVETL